MRIVSGVAQAFTQRSKRARHVAEVGRWLATDRERRIGLSLAVDETQRQLPLRHLADLAHLGRVEANEVRLLGSERAEHALVTLTQPLDLTRDKFKITLPIKLLLGGFGEASHYIHCAPPNTSTSRNTHAGEAWPTRTTCMGSPLPHTGVPNIARVSALPTALRLRQKVDEIPR